MTQNGHWTAQDIPDQTGKVAIVTGANSGLGYETTLALARKGALVVLASRNEEKVETAVSQIRQQVPDASLAFIQLDLADLSSVSAFVEQFKASYDQLHILCNNAGVMAIPYRQTADGFEMQFGVNHLGHFALTGLLLDRLIHTPDARVVTVSSGVHHRGVIKFDDLNSEKTYDKSAAYAQSKLANLLFAYELQRRFDEAGVDTISVAAHPGYADTNLQATGPQMAGSAIQETIMNLANRLFAQSQAQGALPQLYACTMPDVSGGAYYGPDGFMEMRGYPTEVKSSQASYDETAAQRLWQVSEQMTGVTYNIPQMA